MHSMEHDRWKIRIAFCELWWVAHIFVFFSKIANKYAKQLIFSLFELSGNSFTSVMQNTNTDFGDFSRTKYFPIVSILGDFWACPC